MKKLTLPLLLSLCFIFMNSYGQNTLNLNLDSSKKGGISYKDSNGDNITDTKKIDPAEGLIITFDKASFDNVKIENLSENFVEVNKKISVKDESKPHAKFSFTLSYDIINGVKDNNIKVEIGNDENDPNVTRTQTLPSEQTIRNFLENNAELKSKFTNKKKYSGPKSTAYVFLDDKGRPIDNVPVNIDENDIVEFYIISKDKDKLDKFSIRAPDAEYNPVDLRMRPSGPGTQSVNNQYDIAKFELGPYTSETVNFQISFDGTILNTITIRVNKIYHGAFGISPISTGLSNPSYEIINLPNGTDKTVVATNEGSQGMLIANYIYYIQGRDVIKEPTPGQRFGLMIGTSLTNKFTENFFFGGVFEFARGGSIIGGAHYGKYNVLADKNFQLGTSKFSGSSQSDIKLSGVWDLKLFIGISLDLRIFKGLLAVTNQ